MQTQTKVFTGIAVLILVLIGINLNSNGSDTESVTQISDNGQPTMGEPNESEGEMDDVSEEETSDSMVDAEMNTTITPAELLVGTYTQYTPEAVASSEADNIILFFKASWCPSCRTLDNNIKENLSEIPENLEIYEVDYDSSLELRKKYGVTTQHTLVEVNSDGELVKKWSGGNTLTDVVSKL